MRGLLRWVRLQLADREWHAVRELAYAEDCPIQPERASRYSTASVYDGRRRSILDNLRGAPHAEVRGSGWQAELRLIISAERLCVVCGRSFVPSSPRNTHCSGRCIQHAYRCRRKARRGMDKLVILTP